MSQYTFSYGETANGSLKQLQFTWSLQLTWITVVILKLTHASRPNSGEGSCLLASEPMLARVFG